VGETIRCASDHTSIGREVEEARKEVGLPTVALDEGKYGDFLAIV
jgi:hypothetical protein